MFSSALVLALSAAACGASPLDEVATAEDAALAWDPDNRVGPDRRVMLFVHNHFHFGGVSAAESQDRREMIAEAIAGATQLFLDTGVNIVLHVPLTDVESDSGVVVRTTVPACWNLNKQERAMIAMGDGDPLRIHIHWIDYFSPSASGGSHLLVAGLGLPPDCISGTPEENNGLILATADGVTAHALAHELGHYFSLPHSTLAGNLMNPTIGRSLPTITTEQRDQVWDTIHGDRAHLGFLSYIF